VKRHIAALLALVLLGSIGACKPEGGGGKDESLSQWSGSANKLICGVPVDAPPLGRNALFPHNKYWHVVVVIMFDEFHIIHQGGKAKKRCRDPNLSLPFSITLSGVVDGKPGVKGDRVGTPLPWSDPHLISPHYEHLYVGRGAKSWHVKVTAAYVLPQGRDSTPMRYLRCGIWVDGIRKDYDSGVTSNRARVECLHIHN